MSDFISKEFEIMQLIFFRKLCQIKLWIWSLSEVFKKEFKDKT